MKSCLGCPKRPTCSKPCPEIKKQISGRGITSRKKDKTYTVNFNLLESSRSLNTFQLEVKQKLIKDASTPQFLEIEFKELIQKYLTEREKVVIELYLSGHLQQEIARKMRISQARVNILLKQALKKIKKFFIEGL